MAAKKRKPSGAAPAKAKPKREPLRNARRQKRPAATKSHVSVATRKIKKGANPLTKNIVERRLQARIDYTTDPDAKSVEWHYNNPERGWAKIVTLLAFNQWARVDEWVATRKAFWIKVEEKYLNGHAEEIVQLKIKRMVHSTSVINYLAEYELPIFDKNTGAVKRDDKTGKPVYATGVPDLGKVIEAQTKNIQALLAMSGDTLAQAGLGQRAPDGSGVATEGELLDNLDPSEARTIAKALLIMRAPELAEDEVVRKIIDTDGEEAEDE
jgi:hypothetical protein